MKRSVALSHVAPAVLVAALVGACASDGHAPAGTTATAVSDTPFGSSTNDTSQEPSKPLDALPGVLVGAWSSSGDTTEIAYRFVADGRYRSTEIVSQPVPRGIFEFSVVQEGRARIEGDRLVLQPTKATSTRHHPQSPQEDYSDRPVPLTERVYTWRVEKDVLLLRDATGLELSLRRQL